MISTVRARPSHYEMLGLKPNASNEEIERAFAREIGMFRVRPMGGVAQVSIAYETLRDPVRRRAYDDSLGLKPEPRVAPRELRGGLQFIGSAPAPVRPAHDLPQAAPPMPAKQAQPEPAAEARTAPFIAAALRDPVERRPEPEAAPRFEPPARTARAIEALRFEEAEERPVQWQRPAIAAGVLIGGAVLLGALAGSRVGAGEDQAEAAVTAPLPPPKARAATAVAPAPAIEVAQDEPYRTARAVTPSRAKRRLAEPRPALLEEQLADTLQANEAQPATAEPPVAEAPPVATPAALPLPKAVIARTLHRIGYACGEVASASAVEGSRGAYKVACTSGASYQATPVRGRYHFRRIRD